MPNSGSTVRSIYVLVDDIILFGIINKYSSNFRDSSHKHTYHHYYKAEAKQEFTRCIVPGHRLHVGMRGGIILFFKIQFVLSAFSQPELSWHI